MGLICGSEGLLGVVTEVTVKILKKPQVVKAALIGFPSIKEGGDAASEIISSGIVPAGMEIMDRALIEATDNFSKAGYPWISCFTKVISCFNQCSIHNLHTCWYNST